VKRGFTLLELLISLVIVSLVLTVVFPRIVKSDLNSESSIYNRIRTLLSGSFSFSNSPEICVDFKENTLKVGNERIKLPFQLQTLVLPGKIVSSEVASKYCFKTGSLIYGALIGEKEGTYRALLFTLPVGEVKVYALSESEEETLKDKIEKGRITEWFSYYLQ